MAGDLKTTSERRDRFRSWLHDDTRDRLSIRAWCVAEDACDELDALHAADAERIREELRTSGRHYTEPHEYLHNAWPAISARLRAAEAEVERLRALSAEARDMLRDMPWRRGGDALVARLDRAALGEP